MYDVRKRFMTVDEAANYLAVHPATIYRWVNEGILQEYGVVCASSKATKLKPRRKYVRRDQVERLIAPVLKAS